VSVKKIMSSYEFAPIFFGIIVASFLGKALYDKFGLVAAISGVIIGFLVTFAVYILCWIMLSKFKSFLAQRKNKK